MNSMEHDVTKLDEVVLALLHFNSFIDNRVTRAWKSPTGIHWIVFMPEA